MGRGRRMRGSGDNLKHGRHRVHVMRSFVCHEDSQAAGQAAHGGYAAFSPGGFQDLTGHSPAQPGLTVELLLLFDHEVGTENS